MFKPFLKKVFESILPFEITYFTVSKLKKYIEDIFLKESAKRQKITETFKIKIRKNIFHLSDKIRMSPGKNHYFIRFIETGKNETKVSILSRLELYFIFWTVMAFILGFAFVIFLAAHRKTLSILFIAMLIILFFCIYINQRERKETGKRINNDFKQINCVMYKKLYYCQ